jgi:hypothetical protein
MHFSFIPYGKRSEVELLLRDMEAQKHLMTITKDGETKGIYIQGGIRIAPLGIYEYVFPKEALDLVLATLCDKEVPYNIGWLKLAVLKKITQSEPIPAFKTEKKFLWIKDNVSIIPIGIKPDGEMTEPEGTQYPGWKHEAI